MFRIFIQKARVQITFYDFPNRNLFATFFKEVRQYGSKKTDGITQWTSYKRRN